METSSPGPSKGYQKLIKKDDQPAPKREKAVSLDYSSTTAKKWPRLIESIESGKADVVKQLIEEGINVNVIRGGITPLMVAASKGQTEIAAVLLQAGVNVNEKSDDGWTALHKAAFEQADTGIVELLLDSGVDIGAKNKAGKTALQLAEEKRHRDIIRVIKKHQQQLQVDAWEWEEFLNTPAGKPYKQARLHESLEAKMKFWWLPLVALGGVGFLVGLLFKGVILYSVIGLFMGILVVLAASVMEKKMRANLDEIGPLPEMDIHTLRMKQESGEPITEEGAGDIAPLEEHAHIEAPGLKRRKVLVFVVPAAVVLLMAMIVAVLYHYKEPITRWYYVKKIEYRGIRFTEQAFLNEVSQNHEETVVLFLKAGVKLDATNEKGQTALMIASDKGYLYTLNKLARLGPALLNHTDTSGNTALMAAVRQGREGIVKALLETGADVNYRVPRNEGAATALQSALDVPDLNDEQMRLITYLLEKGAHAKDRNGSGRFPLLFAADRGRTDVAKVLIAHGADVNDSDPKGGFPLLSAACYGHSEFVRFLAEQGANLKMTLADGYTPLMCAAQKGHLDTVRVLIERGAEVDAKTSAGSTALTEAMKAGNIDVARLLLQHGANPGSGYVPEAFVALQGKVIAINVKKKRISNLIGLITKAASQDGYTVTSKSRMEQKINMTVKASWNKVLLELARKNHLVLVVKEKEIVILP